MKELKNLALATLGKVKSDFSMEDANTALRAEIEKLICDENGNRSRHAYNRNKETLFELMEETIDDILPIRVEQIFGQFAETQVLAQGQKASFSRKLGRMRGKSFVTTVSPAGTYEAFRLDREKFDIAVGAIGGAARIDWERFLDGLDDMSELVDIVMEAMEEKIYEAIYAQLIAAKDHVRMPNANVVNAAGFNGSAMDQLIAIVKAYGSQAVIFCSPLFAAKISNEVVSTTGKHGYMSAADVEQIRTQGYVGLYKGTPVVVLPMTLTDETNSEWTTNPSYAFVMPTGKEKVVKLVFEGTTQIRDVENIDWSMEMQVYKKFGTAMLYYNNWGIYHDTELESASTVNYRNTASYPITRTDYPDQVRI